MAKQRSSFAKLQRDKAKKERAAEKRAARRSKNAVQDVVEIKEETQGEDPLVPPGNGEISADELLNLIEKLHVKRASGVISEEQFEDAKIELLVRLPG